MTIHGRGEAARVRSTRYATNFIREINRTRRWTETVNEIGIGYRPGATAGSLTSANVASVMELGPGRSVLSVSGDSAAALPALQADPAVAYAYPVLFDLKQNARVVLTDQVIVKLRAGGGDVAAVAAAAGADILRSMRGAADEWVLRLRNPNQDYPVDVADRLQQHPQVEWAQPDTIQEIVKMALLNDPYITNQWHLHTTGQSLGGITPVADNDMDAPEAWDIAPGASNLLVAVIDDGLESGHPEFSGKVDSRGTNFHSHLPGAEPISSSDNHGTACAGLAAAAGGNGVGVAGLAYGARILPVKIFLGSSSASDSDIADAVRYASELAPVLSMSWGYYYAPSDSALQSAVRYARQYGNGGKGSVLLAAAGNDADYFVISAPLPAGVNTCRWVYVKDSSITKGDDACWLDTVVFPGGGSQNFDSLTPPALPAGWTTGTTGAWTSVAASSVHPADSGSRALRSGPMGHGSSSYVQFVTNLASSGILTYTMRINSQDDLSTAWQDYAAFEHRNLGVINEIGGTVAYPAKYDGVLTIGASGSSAIKSDYSQYGPELDFVTPSLGESGTLHIETTDRQGTVGYNTASGTNGDYCRATSSANGFSGTSASTPEAAGLALLAYSVKTNLSPAQIGNIIRASADKLDTGTVNYTGAYGGGRCDTYGWGRANASGAVARARSTFDVFELAGDLKIMELSLYTGDVSYVKILNASSSNTHMLDELALTDNEAGADTAEGACRFPAGSLLSPQAMALVVFSTNLNQAFLDQVASYVSTGGPVGGVTLYEQYNSGLSYGGNAISNMATLGDGVVSIDQSDNLALVITEGAEESYLPDVIDGLVFGVPGASSDSVFGVGPRAEDGAALTRVGGIQSGQTIQRIGTNDSNSTAQDFQIPGGGSLSVPAAPVEILFEDGLNGSGIPSGWTTQIVRRISGNLPSISLESVGVSPSLVRPYEGSNFVRFNSSELRQSTQARMKRNAALTTTDYSNLVVQFAMFHDTANPSVQDSVSVQWSMDGITWQTAGTVYRYGSPTGWALERIKLPTNAANRASVYLALLFTGNGGNDCHVDDLTLEGSPLQWSLIISSRHGSISPYTGTNYYVDNSLIRVSVSEPVADGGNTQYLSQGWFGLGSASSGTGTNYSFRINANSRIDWLWNTQVLMSAGVEDETHGMIMGSTNGWYQAGTNVFSVMVMVDTNYHFGGWMGQVPAGQELNETLAIAIDQSRHVVARVRPDVPGAVSEPWLESYYGDTSNLTALSETDSDGDGLAAWEEYWAGTVPTNADSRFEIRDFTPDGGLGTLTWVGGTGVSGYVVQYSTNLLTGWMTVTNDVVRTPPTNVLVVPVGAAGVRTFYRVSVTNP